MRRFSDKTYWLVGASEGLGRALAQKMAHAGANLIISARNEERLEELAKEIDGDVRVVPMDVGDNDSVIAAAKDVGEIDGMVYLPALYWPLSAREWDSEKVLAMADVNYIGAIRVIGEILPAMVERDAGHIVLTGSLSVYRGLPGAIGYVPVKTALVSLGESMHCDLINTGVDIQVANPGYIKTRLTDKNDFKMPSLMTPEDAAERMMVHMRSDRFKKDFPFLLGLFFRSTTFFPNWLYYRIFGTKA